MADKPTANHTLGIELEGQELKVVHIKYSQGRPTLNQTLLIKTDTQQAPPNHVKLLYINNQKKQLKSLTNKCLIVTGLHSSEVLVRNLTVQLTKEKDIDQVLEFQAEPLLPYPSEDALIDRIILSKGADSSQLTIIAARKDHLAQHLDTWHEIQIEPEVISCSPIALATFSRLFSEITEIHYILHIGETETTSLLVSNGNLLHAQAHQIGVKELRQAFAEDTQLADKELIESFNSCEFNLITEKSHPNLYRSLNKLRVEITKQLLALAKQYPGQEIKDVLLSGSGNTLNGLITTLNQALNKELHLPKATEGFALTEKELIKFSLPIGLALTALPKETNQVNLRQKEYIYPYPWKRIKKPVAIYLSLCIGFAAALFFFGNAYIATKEDQLKKDYLKVLSLMKKPFENIEQEIQKQNPYAEVFSSGKESNIKEMSQSNIKQRLVLLEKEIKETPDIFPLYPNTPRVSDVLAWLSNHPLITITGTDATSVEPRILLENFSYKMVKRPEHNKKKEHYQVKVEIDFSASTPRYAREFHDVLLAPNEIIDPNGDVKWSAERGRYRASFFLKDKTVYPNAKRRA